MIDFSVITKGVETLLKSSPTLEGYVIKRGAFINMDPGLTPWIGIYKDQVDYEILVLGPTRRFRTNPKLKIIIQASSAKGGDQAEEKLEEYVLAVMTVIATDKNLNGTVDAILNVNVNYSFRVDDNYSMHFHNAEITLTAEKRS